MTRLIDANELKEFMNRPFWEAWEYKAICNLINESPTVDAYTPEQVKGLVDLNKKLSEERPQSEWIPVSERLPEGGNQCYLVTVDYGNGLICACQRFFFNSEIGWNDDCVIAWQPLPEPYKKGGKE